MELPEPYHSLPFNRWRTMMKALPQTYATAAVRAWLRERHHIRLRNELATEMPALPPTQLTAEEIKALQEDKRKSVEVLRAYHRNRNTVARGSETPPIA